MSRGAASAKASTTPSSSPRSSSSPTRSRKIPRNSPAPSPPPRNLVPLRPALPLQSLPQQQGRLRRLLSHLIPSRKSVVRPCSPSELTALRISADYPCAFSSASLSVYLSVLSSSPNYSIAPSSSRSRSIAAKITDTGALLLGAKLDVIASATRS